MKGRLGMIAMMAMAGAHSPPLPSNDLRDEDHLRNRYGRRVTPLYGYYGIPFPNLRLVSRETMNDLPGDNAECRKKRAERRERRKARMRLRKRRGFR